jgi:hypothetical protein
MKTTVHIVYFSDDEQIYSKGINIKGKSFSDCCKKFETMKIGLIFNATVKEL